MLVSHNKIICAASKTAYLVSIFFITKNLNHDHTGSSYDYAGSSEPFY